MMMITLLSFIFFFIDKRKSRKKNIDKTISFCDSTFVKSGIFFWLCPSNNIKRNICLSSHNDLWKKKKSRDNRAPFFLYYTKNIDIQYSHMEYSYERQNIDCFFFGPIFFEIFWEMFVGDCYGNFFTFLFFLYLLRFFLNIYFPSWHITIYTYS